MAFKTYNNQAYEQIKRQCRNSGRLFEDSEFPAVGQSLFRFNPPQGLSVSSIEWLRPQEICSNPCFSVDGFDAKDLNQGCVGDCWFIAGAVDVSGSNKYLETVVPHEQTFDNHDYAGVFHFRFWQFGDWVDVVVDDRLPTINGKLCFCYNKKSPNEFWGPLLEKAYAKLAGCYAFLDGGFMQDALVDMTGGVSEYFDIPHEVKAKSKDSLWKSILQSHEMGSLSGATVLPKHGEAMEAKLANGLVVRHAYSVTKVTEISADNQYFKIIKEMMSKIIGKDMGGFFKPVERPMRVEPAFSRTSATSNYTMQQPGIGFEAFTRNTNYLDNLDQLWDNLPGNDNNNNQREDEYNPFVDYDDQVGEDKYNRRGGYDDGQDEYTNPRGGGNNDERGEQGAPIRLLRLRNPWGNHDEWKGAWGDASLEWKLIRPEVKQQLGIVYDHDGEFWMSFNDFIENFDFMCAVHVNLHAFQEQILSGCTGASCNWECKQYHGEWKTGVSAGGSSEPGFWTNPQYLISVSSSSAYGYSTAQSDKATLIVSLMFKDGSEMREANGGNIVGVTKSFRLFRVRGGSTQNHRSSHVKFGSHELELVETSYELSQPREVSIRFRVTPGDYVIIPTTRNSNTPGKFLVRLFTEKANVTITSASLLDIYDESVSNAALSYSRHNYAKLNNDFGHDYLSREAFSQPFASSSNYSGYGNYSASPSFGNYQSNTDLNCSVS